MSRAVAIGEPVRVGGYALAGVEVHAAQDADAVLDAWERLPADVACVIFTHAARAALGERLDERRDLVWAVIPE
jgi:vacuolar-type H+-ATPase subunit F/Vma7